MIKKEQVKKEKPIWMTMNNCSFVWVNRDWQAIDSINNISKAILNLTELFKSQKIEIETMVKVW